jgi:hypothetical protein
MQNFYIKADTSYCVLDAEEHKLGLVAIMDYLTQTGKISDIKVSNAIDSIRSFITNRAGGYWFNFISFRKSATKNASQKTDVYSLVDVANNFKNLAILQSAMKILEASYKKNMSLVDSITTEEFKKYFNYDETANYKASYYASSKMRNQSYSYHSKAREEYNNKQAAYVAEYLSKFPTYLIKNVLELNDFARNHYKTVYAAWKKVLNDDGSPKSVEEDGFIQRFNEKDGYALFLEERYRNEGNFGFWGSTNSSLTDINQAKLFQNLKQAHRYASSMRGKGVAIVKVNVKFEEVSQTIGQIDTSALEAAKSAQEKAYLDSLMNDDNEVKSLAKKLLSACGESAKYEELKNHLNKLVEEKEEVIVAKKKNKI